MSPEVLAALIGGLITSGPAYLALRRARGTAQAEGAATRESVEAVGQRLDSRINDVRDDIDGVREDVSRVREWQAGHDAEHLLIGRERPGGDA